MCSGELQEGSTLTALHLPRVEKFRSPKRKVLCVCTAVMYEDTEASCEGLFRERKDGGENTGWLSVADDSESTVSLRHYKIRNSEYRIHFESI